MARFYAERVAFTTPTTDDGNVAIGSRLGNSFRLPSETTIANGDNPILLIQEGDDIEVVEATYVSAGPHFTLDTVIFSIISGSVGTTKMNLNGAAEVRFMSASADDLENMARKDIEDQTLSGGARVTEKDLGTISSGTVTPDPGDRPMQKYTNGGAHTLAPGSNVGAYLLTIVNNSSAGAVTTSGWTKVAGGAFTTTNGHKFRCHASVTGDGSLLIIQALQ